MSPADKMCPIMSAGDVIAQAMKKANKPAPLITGVGGSLEAVDDRPEAVGCAGPQCALFVKTFDEKGVESGGSCALALTPLALGQIAGIVSKVLVSSQLKQ